MCDNCIDAWEPWSTEITHLSGPESAVLEEPGDLDLTPPWRVLGFGNEGNGG